MKLVSILLLTSALTLSAAGQNLPADRSPYYNPRAPEGVFDIIAYVDGESFIYVRNTDVTYLVSNGAPPRGAGTNYTQPIPQAIFGSFNMEKVAGRGNVDLVEPPSGRNNYTAVLRIKDDKAGSELYHVRLTWTWNPNDPGRSPNVPGNTRNDSRDPRNDSRNDDRNRNDDRGNNNGGDRSGEFTFQGRVDDVTVLYIRDNQVRSEVLSGRAVSDQRTRFSDPIPTTRLSSFEMVERNGRGQIELVEKPWEGNRFTAVVKITDKSGGAGDYSFKLAWRR